MPAHLWYPLLALTGVLILPTIAFALIGSRAGFAEKWVTVQSAIIDWVSNTIGVTVAWATLLMVLAQFAVVVMRYVFGFNSIGLQESVVYAHGIVFMLGSAYTLLAGGHVRVDIFYQNMSGRQRALVDLLGSLLLLAPFMLLVLYYAWSYVEIAWRIREGSRESSGLPYIYLLKSVILLFAGLMLLQGISIAGRAALVLRGTKVEAAP